VTRIVLGRVAGPFGIRGWVKVASFTDPPLHVLDYPRWRAESAGGVAIELRPLEGRSHGKGLVVRLAGVDDRNAAEALGKLEFWVERAELPALSPGEHYRADLVGFEVVNLQGIRLGRVDGFLDMLAIPVMVVVGERERWLPVGPGQLLRVDPDAGRITVDWDAEF
jgi:16S rRNA processing protein RimM